MAVSGESVMIVAITAAASVVISIVAGVTFYNTQELQVANTLDAASPESCIKSVYMMDSSALGEETTKRLAICRGYKVNLPANK